MPMDLRLLKRGHRIRTTTGYEAVVLEETNDGERVRIRYLYTENEESPIETESLVSSDEVEVLLGIAHLGEWGKQIGVTLLLERGDEGFPDLYRAITMTGVPYGVTVTGESEGSGKAAVDHLASGLRVFGYDGTLLIHDVTVSGRSSERSLRI